MRTRSFKGRSCWGPGVGVLLEIKGKPNGSPCSMPLASARARYWQQSGWAEKEEKGRGSCVICLGPWSCVFAEVEWWDSQGSELASLDWWAGDTCLGAI